MKSFVFTFEKNSALKHLLIMLIFFQIIMINESFGQNTDTTIKKSNNLNAKDLITLENEKKLLANKNYKYKATIWNTNFTIPAARFNFSDSPDNSKGTVSFFNSVGAGIGRSKGEIREIRDSSGEVFEQDFTNTFAWYFGFLFAADTGEEKANVFAPLLSLVILDFQVGIGYDLGTIQSGNKRTFLTLGYNIPINKLRRGGYYITKSSGVIDDTQFGAGRLGK